MQHGLAGRSLGCTQGSSAPVLGVGTGNFHPFSHWRLVCTGPLLIMEVDGRLHLRV